MNLTKKPQTLHILQNEKKNQNMTTQHNVVQFINYDWPRTGSLSQYISLHSNVFIFCPSLIILSSQTTLLEAVTIVERERLNHTM